MGGNAGNIWGPMYVAISTSEYKMVCWSCMNQ